MGTPFLLKCFSGEKQEGNVRTNPLQDEKLKFERDLQNSFLKNLRNRRLFSDEHTRATNSQTHLKLVSSTTNDH